MDPTRRTFLLGALGASGTLALTDLLSIAKASNATPTVTDQYFVFAHFLGGWDAIITLDPKDPAIFDDTPLTIAEYGVETGYDALGFTEDPRIETDVEGMFLGPYAQDLAEFASRMSIVRGMTVSSVAHIPAQMHLNTGKIPGGTSPRGSSIATILASILGESELIPNLVSGVPSYNIDRPPWCSGLGATTVSELRDLLAPGISALDAGERDALDEFFDREASRISTPRIDAIMENRSTSRMLIEENVSSTFDLYNSDVAELVDRLGNKQALMAYQALTKGYSRCVSFQAMPFSDAHNGAYWRNLHRYHLQGGFQEIATLARELDATPYPTGGTWLDHTTIVCCSEFNRSPFLNDTGGRDHGATNTCMLLGGNIAQGKIIGGTHNKGMAAQSINLATGAIDENGTAIAHEHIASTLIHSLGVEEDVGDFRAPPIEALLV